MVGFFCFEHSFGQRRNVTNVGKMSPEWGQEGQSCSHTGHRAKRSRGTEPDVGFAREKRGEIISKIQNLLF